MANNKPNEETRTSIDEVNDTLTGIGEKVQSNPKVVVWSCVAVAAVVAIILVYVYAIRQPDRTQPTMHSARPTSSSSWATTLSRSQSISR